MANKSAKKKNDVKEIKVDGVENNKEKSTDNKNDFKENIDDKQDNIKSDKEENKANDNVKAEEKQDKKADENKAEPKKTVEEEIAEWKNKYLRLSADFDNYRKRTLKEKMDLIKTAGADTIKSIIPIIDDFERAIAASKETKEIDAIKKGNDLIYNKFKEFLKQNGIKEIEALNKDFDTDLHEAITKIPAPKKKQKGKVIDVIEKGYFLNDKVLRFAKVVVGD